MNLKYLRPLLSIVLLLTISLASAQDEAKFSAGVKVLGNMNKFEKADLAFGYGAGGFANYKVLDFLTARAEVLYVNYAAGLQNYSKDMSSIGITSINYSNRTLRFHSLEIPVLAQVSVPFMESLNPKFYVGGSYAYNFGVYETSDRNYLTTNESGAKEAHEFKNRSENVTSSFSKYNTTAIVGAQVSFDMVTVDVRYQQGFPTLNNVNTLGSNNNLGSFKSRTLSLSVGFKIF
jgi:hypothetical protein